MTTWTKTSRIARAAAGLLAAALTVGMAGFAGTTAASAAEPTYQTYDFALSGLPTHNDGLKSSSLGIVAVNSDKDVPTAVLNNGTTTKDKHTTETKYVGVKPGEYNVTYTATGDQLKTAQVGMYPGSRTADGIFTSDPNAGKYSSFSLTVKGNQSGTSVESKTVDLKAGAYLTVLGNEKGGTIHLTATTPTEPAAKSAAIVGKDGNGFTNNTTTLKVNEELGLSAKLENVDKADFDWAIEQTDKVLEFVDMGANPATDVRVKAVKAGKATVTLTGKKGTAAEGVSAKLTVTVTATEPEQPTQPKDVLSGFSAAERTYLETSYWTFPEQQDTSKGFDGWAATTTVYTKLTDAQLKGLHNSVPGYSAQDAEKLFHYTAANGTDQGGAKFAVYKNGKAVRSYDDFDTQTVTYTGRESGATVTYVFTTLDKVVLEQNNNNGNNGQKPNGETNDKKPAVNAGKTTTPTTGNNANAPKSNALAKTGTNVAAGVVAALALLGVGGALMLRRRSLND
ncbi:hypothetical protein [Bifidobacterium catulorum]|uniref:Gram-positive cocci surface proteins LPxTG domain-containing protein n=1 Tax=Bifidobacterium catulorum TaxID=1630173 RepID=A0A2U2MS76_9BIFI|nr:hypothetical protein [Bifidobacterium catulorum]PWG59711.1 hypothetical protein DF200_06135 [Bifidobacterium catulorum]